MSADRRSPFLERFAVAVVGWSIIVLGIILMPLPGPGTVLVLVGLSILAREYPWAGRVLERVREGTGRAARWARRRMDPPPDPGGPEP